MRFLDLSHTIEHGMTTYPGLPGPLICDFLSREASRERYAPGVEFQIGKIEMVANTGTYLDAPFHRYADGKDISRLPLESLVGIEAVVVRGAHGARSIGPDVFAARDVGGKAVLVRTGWDVHWGTPTYLDGAPFLTSAAAEFLVAEGAVLVGIDSLNIDDMGDLARPVHSLLLGADIPIVEHLCQLGPLPESGCRFTAVPAKVAGFGTWPVRAFATL
ncbi:MAG TPA: cyclase family protein [Gemmatimonadales bacterium]|nr:cyclase family protein [Gemmatimonadales bacterium]